MQKIQFCSSNAYFSNYFTRHWKLAKLTTPKIPKSALKWKRTRRLYCQMMTQFSGKLILAWPFRSSAQHHHKIHHTIVHQPLCHRRHHFGSLLGRLNSFFRHSNLNFTQYTYILQHYKNISPRTLNLSSSPSNAFGSIVGPSIIEKICASLDSVLTNTHTH